MGFLLRNNGLDCYRLAKTRKDCKCFICRESIARGDSRYAVTRYLSLCTKCAECWDREGGRLGDISRTVGDTAHPYIE